MTEQEAMEIIMQVAYDGEFPLNSNEAFGIACKCIEKQIPKAPYYSGDGYYNGKIVIDTWECPCCGKQYEVDYDYYEYCHNCGQHIDHSTFTEDD